MVICDLFVIHNLLRMDRYVIHTRREECVESHIYEVWQIVCHIVCQVSAVCTGISDQLLFIEVLGVIQSLLCRIAQHTVGVSLQTGQIIERRRLFTFLLTFCLCDRSDRAISADCFGIRLLFEAFACCRKPIQSNLNRIEGFRFESGNCCFTHDCHRKGGRHDSTNIQGLPVKGRKKSSSVNANNPVGSLSTKCCFIQSIIFSSRPEIFKALPDSGIFHGRNPKPLKWFSAPGFVVHQTKDQFTLTTGICRTHKAGNIVPGHELFQDTELLLGSGRNLIPPVRREDRQVSIHPFAVFRIVGFGLCQLHQMTDTPADHISVSFEVAIFTLVCTKNLCNALCD